MKPIIVIFRMMANRISFEELVRFLYGETPPQNHNFLNYDYTPHIDNIVRFGSDKNNPSLFSIIIPTYNRSGLLLKTINAITKQKDISSDTFELVIVDNGSKDKTEEAVKHFADQNGRINIIYIKLKRNYGADFARNVAVLNSRGNLFAFTDDDCIVPDNWLVEFKKELETDPEIAGVGGFKEPRPIKNRLDIYHRFLMWKHFYYPHVRSKEFDHSQNQSGLTANVCYRKNALKKLGGFNQYFKHIGFLEFKIRAHKSRLKLLYEPKMVKHFADFSLSVHIRKCLIQGLDWYFLYLLHPNIRQNPTFLFFLKRIINDIKLIFNYPTAQERSRYLMRSDGKIKILDKIRFSFISIVTNFCLWLGKYWIIAFG